MNKMLITIKSLFKPVEPIDHSYTDRLVKTAQKQSKNTLRKIDKFNAKLERTSTYFVAKAMGRIES